jgi:ABC-type antimicrobial peptide transport system permease subunit
MRTKIEEEYSMRRRFLASLGVMVGVTALVSLAAFSMGGQAPAAPKPAAAPAAAKAPSLPRTAWGEPDLQGVWFVLADVPLERSAANAGKAFLTEDEVAAADKQKGINPGRNARSANSSQDVTGAYNAVFNSVLKTGKRTSMIIDPPDGKIPPLVGGTPAGRGGGRGAALAGSPNDNPETTAQSPRCLGVQMPFLPLNTAFAQGTVMQIVQSPKSMGIYMEDDHAGGGNRVILMDGRPHLPPNANSVLGDSRGHWEGNTLVVETTNFSQGFRGSNPDTYRMTERFTRVDANNLKREITFDDPKTWTRPWTVLIEMGKTDDHRHMIFDSACHEGNYGMTGILIGARKEEQANKK